jgi:hypothetical protein
MSEIPPPPSMPQSMPPQMPPNMGMPQQSGPGKGMAITSLILGIVSVALCLYWFIALPAGIVAVVLGVMARKRGVGAGLALAGIITGAIGAVLGLIIGILALSGGGFVKSYCTSNSGNAYCQQQGY